MQSNIREYEQLENIQNIVIEDSELDNQQNTSQQQVNHNRLETMLLNQNSISISDVQGQVNKQILRKSSTWA